MNISSAAQTDPSFFAPQAQTDMKDDVKTPKNESIFVDEDTSTDAEKQHGWVTLHDHQVKDENGAVVFNGIEDFKEQINALGEEWRNVSAERREAARNSHIFG